MTNSLNVSPVDSMEIILSHDGADWVTNDNESQLRGRTLDDIDRVLLRYLKETKIFKDHVKVCMRFDMSALPRWLHQYSGHYFNRTVTFLLPADDQFGKI